ncbi:hemolysin family protein [Treponema sp.]|uniref:hemolysin family protein n=1 Tax=Treponema sp. TaxID=166 RepID=UPI003F0CBA1B
MDSPDVPLPALFAAAVVLVVLSTIFSAAESAFFSVNKLRVRLLRGKQDKRAMRVWRLLKNRDRLINTLLVGNNIVNIALSAVFTFAAVGFFGTAGIGFATFFVTILLLVFGEITPKIIATHHPEAVAFFFSFFVEATEVILFPLVSVFTAFSRIFLRIFRADISVKKVSYTEEEIKTFLDVGCEQGILKVNEKNMMSQVFKFTDLEAKDIMIPRKHIKAVSVDESYSSIIEKAQRLGFSRFPVYQKDIDDIVGIIYIKDMLPFKACASRFSVRNTMRPPLFILETKKMSGIQQMLWENRQSMAVVIDEYSGTYGILTREDIVREIFGPVTDGKNIRAHKANLLIENTHDCEIDGLARLIDLNERLGVRLLSENCETIGGFVCEQLGAIPQAGNFIRAEGYKFTVVKMEDNRVQKIHVHKEEK